MKSLITFLGVLVALASPIRAADSNFVEFNGRAIDDETGKSVNDFALQWGVQEKDGKIKWGYGMNTSSRRTNGEFHEQFGWGEKSKVSMRIISDGYIPQAVTDEPVESPTVLSNLVVRLKHGGELHGIVIDHDGKPVDQAKVYVADAQPLDLTDGQAPTFKGTNATTDVSGEFSVRGLDPAEKHRLVVQSPTGLHAIVWTSDIDKRLTVNLAEPATLLVKYDIEGDLDSATLRIEAMTWEDSETTGVNIVRQPKVANGGQIEITDIAPGTYDFVRMKEVRVGDRSSGHPLDRHTLTVKAGEKQTIELVRPHGRRLRGEVTGMNDSDLPGAFIYVQPAESKDRFPPLFDVLGCKADDGHFQTAALEPGSYKLRVEGYFPEKPSNTFVSGMRVANVVAEATVTIPADKDPEPVKIELRVPRRE